MKFAMFFMAEYANMITVACVATLMFSGWLVEPVGHSLPDDPASPFPAAIVPVFWFVGQGLGFLFLYIWVRGTLAALPL